jgi:hypothetical protein
MTNASINTKSYLDYLRKRRAKIDALISAIEEFDDDGSSHDDAPDPAPNHSKPTYIGLTREYRGMTIAAATVKFLRAAGTPQLTGDIARALKNGGIGSNSKNMYRTVYNTLNNRMDKHQDIMKEGGKWGLAEWKTQ